MRRAIFLQNLNADAIEAGYNKYSYTNFCVNGVSSESYNVCRRICDFLSSVIVFSVLLIPIITLGGGLRYGKI